MFKTVFDRDFKYRSADETDLRRTFARIRREQRSIQQGGGPERATARVVRIPSPPDSQESKGEWPFP